MIHRRQLRLLELGEDNFLGELIVIVRRVQFVMLRCVELVILFRFLIDQLKQHLSIGRK